MSAAGINVGYFTPNVRVPGITRVRHRYSQEGMMELTLRKRVRGLEELMKPLPSRIGALEDKVHHLDTWAGPGQNEALSDNIIAFRAETNRKLDGLTKDLTKVGNDVSQLTTQFGGFRNEMSRLSGEVAGLQTDMTEVKKDVAGLKGDMTEVKGDVSTLKGDVSTLKGDVSTLKGDVAELKTDMVQVKGALAEILDRLPLKEA